MNSEQNDEQLLEVESTHPGTVLRQAREAMGLSDQDVADRLRLRVSVIRELEDNCCDDQQIATFTRGYIRSYAKLVGVDADALLGNFKPAPETEDNAQKMQSFSRKTRREKHDSHVMSLTWVILAAAVGLTAFWWWQNQQDGPLALQPATNTEEMVVETADAEPVQNTETVETLVAEENLPLNAEVSEVVETPETESPVVETVSETPEVSEPASTPEAIEETAPVVEEVIAQTESVSPNMTLSFKGDCWVDIRDASGKRLLTGIKSAGETVDLSGEAPFKLVLGAPSAVSLVYNGENVDLSGYPSGRVARLSLPK